MRLLLVTMLFKVGTACSGTGDGLITGVVRCSTMSGAPLSAINCPISKPSKTYNRDAVGVPRLNVTRLAERRFPIQL